MKGIGGHQRAYQGRTDDWITPAEVIRSLGGHEAFALDPCACVTQPWPTAKEMWSPPVDGLLHPWYGRVWLNPPYGPQTIKWLAKLSAHGNGIALIFARTETQMFHNHIWGHASLLLFLRGRLSFHYPNGHRSAGNSGGPSVLVAYGTASKQLHACRLAGAFVTQIKGK